jgi:hypothetical protein
MFRKNEAHRQVSMFSAEEWLPENLQEQLQASWAETFYNEVFCRIDEARFASLYSSTMSRPNVPVNVLVSLEILKSGFGWSDEELYEQVCFNLQVRHALGLRDLGAGMFTLRTLYNFRRRIREHTQESGCNLMQTVFEDVTDTQLASVSLATGWQRMDSTQVLSNLAHWTRLELLVGVMQTIFQKLTPDQQACWQKRVAPYLEGRPHQVCYRIRGKAQEAHLIGIGQLLAELEAELLATQPPSTALPLLQRVLDEQYIREKEVPIQLRPAKEVASDSLQSPYDEEATYRVKNGKTYRGGYVINVSETADPQNPVQLVIDVQVEPNHTDDAQLLTQSLDSQIARGVAVKQITTDGGYTGPTSDTACDIHKVELRATQMRGGRSAPHHWGWEAYTWEVNCDGLPCRVICPEGQCTTLSTSTGRRFVAHFDADQCAGCPFRDSKCRIQWRKRAGPTLYVKRSMIDATRRRACLHPEDGPIRAVVEATVREIKHPFPGGKLPVRGLVRTRMVIYGAALMTNLRRLHRYAQAKTGSECPSDSDQPLSILSTLISQLKQRLLPKLSHLTRYVQSRAPISVHAALSS